ncbi:AMP-binding protein [Cellulomonas sp.]|uniref:AMP-binding protein n=1 Tax=Cellulomonas sp. TaxID=40001 RepID=UPI0028125626|nr:AMP-binding protein [Cellulomonas sp.]
MRATDGDARDAAGAGSADRAPDLTAPDGLLAEYAPMGAATLADAERWPSLRASDLARVAQARAHPAAPVWVHETGDRLDEADLRALGGGESATAGQTRRTGTQDDPPAWVADLVARAHAVVPRYRRPVRAGTSGPSTPLADLPRVTRADLVADLAAHVPVDVPLDRVLEGTSSGSTGAALRVPLHPRTVASDLLLLHGLVTAAGARWEADADRLGLLNLVDQRTAFTYVSAMSAFPRPAGTPVPLMARANLDPSAWRAPGDRERWLADVDPQVVSTSALPLLHLLELAAAGLDLHPVAVVNGATHVTPAVRAAVRATWDAPLVDLYGLRETGPVAAAPDDGGHVVVDRRVHVEVLDADGVPVPDGVRGEVVVTVDENPYLPLLRYRTGDHAALRRDARGTALVGLEGRAPVRFADAGGRWRPSVDATQVLQAAGLLAWHLHQAADGTVRLVAVPGRAGAADEAARAVRDWLGRPVELEVRDRPERADGKPHRFTTDLDAATRRP